MWANAGVFIGGAMFGATLGIGLLLAFQLAKDVDKVAEPSVDAAQLDAERQAGYDEGLEAGRQLERNAQTAKRSAAGRKAAATRKARG